MFKISNLNPKAKSEINTGFGVNSSDYSGRFLNKDGDPNIGKKGVSIFERISWYHTMLKLPVWKFFAVIFLFFIGSNLVFASIYFLIGADHLHGMVYDSGNGKFAEAFFFSCQTFTTVGYGRINPVGFLASAIASFEALIGLLSFALATGLFYGRFSKPKAYLRFSKNALLSPFQGNTAIMFRVAPFKNTTLVDAEAKVTLAISLEEEGKKVNKFFQLPLEYSTVNALTLSWTIVHPINESSPLYNLTQEDFANLRGEIIVYLKAFDDMFSNIVVARTSYIFKEVIVGAKFKPMFEGSETGNKTILYLDRLNSYTTAEIKFVDNVTI
jgi:inward rectifier potassium channel